MAGEVVDPCRTFPRAITISGLSIAACYLLGTICPVGAPQARSRSFGVNSHHQGGRPARDALARRSHRPARDAGGSGGSAPGSSPRRGCSSRRPRPPMPPIFARTHPRWKTPGFAMFRRLLGDLHPRATGRHGQELSEARQRDPHRYSCPLYMFAPRSSPRRASPRASRCRRRRSLF
jgi:hypothetical protein